MPLHAFNQTMTIAGTVSAVDQEIGRFAVEARSTDVFELYVGPSTVYQVMSNLDGMDRDRVERPDRGEGEAGWLYDLRTYVSPGRPVFVNGIYQEDGGEARFEARVVYLLHSATDRYLFEETHWWPSQTTQMADRILDHLFDERRSYSIDDFAAFYTTNLNILGQPVDDDVQECAVLSRLLYDLSSAYLMTGADRYFMAARAAAGYLRQAFRSLSHDGRYCFWAHGRRRSRGAERGEYLLFASKGPDDVGTIPLYEQIYALAGLTQYYRITQDAQVLDDIRRTMASFQDFFWDPPSATQKGFAGAGGYYSHLDPATMRPETVTAPENRSRKNWNSIGDHIPAYLVNLILAIDPLPRGPAAEPFEALLDVSAAILEETSELICDRFVDPTSDFVVERFHADWSPDLSYRWQQNRAVVGHNLKIAWNLTRCAHFFLGRSEAAQSADDEQAAKVYRDRADRCLAVARRLADRMAEVGLDRLRGGIFDCVERAPSGGMPTQFAWGATKDFWQQEQGILAYLILHGATGDARYLQLARESSAFWNLFFLDRERQGYFFRTTENGLPVLEGQYGMKSSHAIGYHAFELSFLAHVYTRAYVAAGGGSDNSFCLYFRPERSRGQRSVNVLPDFMPPGSVRIASVSVNGVDVTRRCNAEALDRFQVTADDPEADLLSGSGGGLVVEFVAHPRNA